MPYIEATAYDSTDPYVLVRQGDLVQVQNQAVRIQEEARAKYLPQPSSPRRSSSASSVRVEVQYQPTDDAQEVAKAAIAARIQHLAAALQTGIQEFNDDQEPAYSFPDPTQTVQRTVASIYTSTIRTRRQLELLICTLEEIMAGM